MNDFDELYGKIKFRLFVSLIVIFLWLFLLATSTKIDYWDTRDKLVQIEKKFDKKFDKIERELNE